MPFELGLFSLSITALLTLLALGVGAGIMAGLLGVGGGLIIVPVLIFIFEYWQLPKEHLTQMAVATSLASIVFTSLSSIRSYHRLKLIPWAITLRLSGGLLVGAFIGANVVSALPGSYLQGMFGFFAFFVALQMMLSLKPKALKPLPGSGALALYGSAIGVISALFGIGGGSLTVPLLSWLSLDVRRAIATAAACGFPIAFASVAGFVVSAQGVDDLPKATYAYIYLPALVVIVLASVPSAHLGTILASRLPVQRLKLIFAVFLLLVAVQFLLKFFGIVIF